MIKKIFHLEIRFQFISLSIIVPNLDFTSVSDEIEIFIYFDQSVSESIIVQSSLQSLYFKQAFKL